MLDIKDSKLFPYQKGKKHILIEVKEYLDAYYEFRRNLLTAELEVNVISSKEGFKTLDEPVLNTLYLLLQVNGYNVSMNKLISVLNSHLVQSYHPIKEYFKGLTSYDGHDYIGDLAKTIKITDLKSEGIELRNLWRTYLEKWLIGCVATATSSRANHLCLVLVGKQGKGKTRWLNRLCPKSMQNYLVCSHINPSLTDNNTANYLAEKWFINIDDQLETIFGKDFNSMKAIITAPSVTNRKAYARLTLKRDRVASFMGSVNSPKFLTDTENRRYLVFSTDSIDYEHTIDVDKVWSQAYYLLKQKKPYWFNGEEIKQLNCVNEIYRQSSPEEEWLMKLFEPANKNNSNAMFLMTSDILSRIKVYSGLSNPSIKKISAAMDKFGFGDPISKRVGNSKSPRKVYPVIERKDYDEEALQNDYRNEYKRGV